ncbi:protein xhlA, partial [Bacillus paralicheniformis]|nr:protein xhlA [Bacillus paralicheniformis]
MTQPNDYDVLQKEIAEIKADQRTQDQRITTLERTTDRHDQQIISINEKLNKI